MTELIKYIKTVKIHNKEKLVYTDNGLAINFLTEEYDRRKESSIKNIPQYRFITEFSQSVYCEKHELPFFKEQFKRELVYILYKDLRELINELYILITHEQLTDAINLLNKISKEINYK